MARGTKKKELIESLPNNCFWVNNGPILGDLQDLHIALKNEISSEQFSHHVNEEKNDFADWIEKTLHDHECAKMVRGVKKQSTAADKVKSCLKGYKI